MATEPLKLTTVTAVLALVTSTELLGWAVRHLGGSPLFWLGGLRLVQIGALVWIVVRLEKRFNTKFSLLLIQGLVARNRYAVTDFRNGCRVVELAVGVDEKA